jgi:uncharacterized membrane protein YozB (DUF420 family)
MTEILDNIEMVLGLIAFVLVVLGILKIHKSKRTKSSFMMFFGAIATIVFSIIYLALWISYKFYYSPDNSPVALSIFMASADYIYTLLFLISAIGFWGFAKSIKAKVAE